MSMQITIESLPAKEYLVIKGFVELGGGTPDAYAEQERQLNEKIRDGAVGRLKSAAGAKELYGLFCNTCKLDEKTGGYICGNDIACENFAHAQAGGEFEIVRLAPAEYAVFDCVFDKGTSKAAANKAIDDAYWGEWLRSNPYESMIETTTGADTPGIACISLIDPPVPDAERFCIKIWFPIRRK